MELLRQSVALSQCCNNMLGWLLLLVCVPFTQSSDSKSHGHGSKPHILFIMADDHGWNDVGYHGSEIKTPVIDQLAKDGMIMNSYYTAPNCGPSRSQFLTGKYLGRLGLQHKNLTPCRPRGLPLSETTIADELGNLGYTNHMIGKWHAGFHTVRHLPTARGFHTFRGMLNGEGDHFKHDKSYHGKRYLDFYNDTTPYNGSYNVYSTDAYALRAMEIIAEHNRTGDPMFMWLSFQAPHTPNQAPARFLKQYAWIRDDERRRYAAMVTAMDEAIGDIVATLEDNNMLENTVIVFSSDNGGQALSGGASNYPLRGNKATFYEAGIRALGFVSSPLLNSSGETNALIHVTDWMPTFVHLAGGYVDDNIDGVNQWDALSLNGPSARMEIIYNVDPLDIAKDGDARAPAQRKRTNLESTNSNSSAEEDRDVANRDSTPLTSGGANTRGTNTRRNFRAQHPRRRNNRRKSRKRNRTRNRRRNLLLRTLRRRLPRSIDQVPFNTRQLAAIRYKQWKLLTGNQGYNGIVPNPVINISAYANVNKRVVKRPLVQLFNVKTDPTESEDVSESNPEVVELLLAKLAKHAATARKPFFPSDTYLCDPALNGNVWGPYITLRS